MRWTDGIALLSFVVAVANAEYRAEWAARTGGTSQFRRNRSLVSSTLSMGGIAIALAINPGALPGQVYWLYRHLKNALTAHRAIKRECVWEYEGQFDQGE